ncbi:hypothetical protein AB0E04_03890 [Streptomyces sp. NPDC048251]|uniref:hypothetical protein n=1 Tax=Streptomyces sp. NPDC048251 TaxID=3154501 RepID=UPI003414C92E
MSDFWSMAADWLEHGRPSERPAIEEVARFGSLLWAAGGARAYGRQDPDAFRLSVVGAGETLTYEVLGVDGGCLR